MRRFEQYGTQLALSQIDYLRAESERRRVPAAEVLRELIDEAVSARYAPARGKTSQKREPKRHPWSGRATAPAQRDPSWRGGEG